MFVAVAIFVAPIAKFAPAVEPFVPAGVVVNVNVVPVWLSDTGFAPAHLDVKLTVVLVPPDQLALTAGFAAQAVPPQVPLMAFARLFASVDVVPV
jgi:hypothetical protein